MKNEIAITAYKCKKCGKIQYPFHDCLSCKGREFEKIKPEGNATLLTIQRSSICHGASINAS